MSRACRVLIVAGMAAAVLGFFLPWVRIEARAGSQADGVLTREGLEKVSRHVGRVTIQVDAGSEHLESELADLAALPLEARGVELPRLARDERVRLLRVIAGALAPEHDVPMERLALVTLVPVLAVVSGLALCFSSRPSLTAALGALALAAAGIGAWWLLASPGSGAVRLTWRLGVWVCVGAYAELGLAGVALAAIATRRRRT